MKALTSQKGPDKPDMPEIVACLLDHINRNTPADSDTNVRFFWQLFDVGDSNVFVNDFLSRQDFSGRPTSEVLGAILAELADYQKELGIRIDVETQEIINTVLADDKDFLAAEADVQRTSRSSDRRGVALGGTGGSLGLGAIITTFTGYPFVAIGLIASMFASIAAGYPILNSATRRFEEATATRTALIFEQQKKRLAGYLPASTWEGPAFCLNIKEDDRRFYSPQTNKYTKYRSILRSLDNRLSDLKTASEKLEKAFRVPNSLPTYVEAVEKFPVPECSVEPVAPTPTELSDFGLDEESPAYRVSRRSPTLFYREKDTVSGGRETGVPQQPWLIPEWSSDLSPEAATIATPVEAGESEPYEPYYQARVLSA